MSDILVSAINYYYNHPVEFVEDIIGAKPTFQQAEIMRDLVEYRRVAVRSGRGIGKTGCESWLIMWFMWTRPYPKIPCTAPSQHQLFDILWSELYKWINQSKIKLYFEWTKTHLYNKQEPGNWFAVAQSCKDPSNMSGFHADHMMFLIDEAAGVAPEIMDIIEGSLTKKNSLCLLCGNPLKLSGFFHDAFHKDRDIWKCLHYSSIDSPLVDNTFVERMKKYGINSNVYRVNVLGEFPEQEDDTVISLTKIEEAVNRRVEIDYQREHEIHIGNDVARFGDDKTEIFVRLGNKIIENESHEKEDLMKTAGRMSAKILKYKEKYIVNANIDDTGLGGGVTDRLNELYKDVPSVNVNGVNNGEKAYDSVNYANMGTELWFLMEEGLEEMQIPDNDELIAQLSTRRYFFESKGQRRLESKKDIKKRSLPSPDKADALSLTFFKRRRKGIFYVG